MEIGALAAWTPAKTAQIEPYAGEYYPKVFEQKETSILTVAPERTFWEKATILHHEANRPEHRFAALEADYDSMKDMLYGDVPTFDTVIAAVRELEKEIITL